MKRPRGRPKVLNGDVQTIQMHMESELCAEIDDLVRAGRFSSRADFIREAARTQLDVVHTLDSTIQKSSKALRENGRLLRVALEKLFRVTPAETKFNRSKRGFTEDEEKILAREREKLDRVIERIAEMK